MEDNTSKTRKKVSWGVEDAADQDPNPAAPSETSQAQSLQGASSILKKSTEEELPGGSAPADHVIQRGGDFQSNFPSHEYTLETLAAKGLAATSLLDEASQSDPGTGQSLSRSTPLSPNHVLQSIEPQSNLTRRSRWKSEFIRSKSDRTQIPGVDTVIQGYFPKGSKPRLPTLVLVDTSSVGSEECRARTMKQWDTIIYIARLHALTSISDEKSRLALINKSKHAPLPDENGCIKMVISTKQRELVSEREKQAEKALRGDFLPSRLELLSFNTRRMPPTNIGSSSPEKNESDHQNDQDESSTIAMPSSPDRHPAAPLVLAPDYSYVDSAAMEELLNDSELIRGQGYVPVNRVHQVEMPVVDTPWKLPEFACRDLEFALASVLSSEKHLDEKPRTLHWNGASDERVAIVDEEDLSTVVSFHLQKIKAIKYSMHDTLHHLLFEYSLDDESKDGTMVLEVDAPKLDFAMLKRCCYSAKVTFQQSCDSAPVAYFESVRQEINLKHNPPKRPPMPPRLEVIAKKRRGRAATRTKELEQLESSPQAIDSESRDQEQDEGVVVSSDESESGIPNTLPPGQKIAKRKSTSAVAPGTKKRDVYYDTSDQYQVVIRVTVGDLVVRVHRKEGLYLDHDGPWRIVNLRKVSEATLINGHDGNASSVQQATKSDYDEESWANMLSTEVELNIPKGSRAKKWIRLSKVLPIIDMKNVLDGDVYSSDPTVESMETFVALKNRLSGSQQPQPIAFDRSPTNIAMPGEEEPLYCFKIAPSLFLATIEVQPYLEDDEDSEMFEIQKLTSKRLRIFEQDDPMVKEEALTTEEDDPWVQRVQKYHPELLVNRVVVAEYLAHWAGWAVEDNTWTIGQNNIGDQAFVDRFDQKGDPFHDVPLDVEVDINKLVYQEPEPEPKKDVAAVPTKGVAVVKKKKKKKRGGKRHVSDEEDARDETPTPANTRQASRKHPRRRENSEESDKVAPSPKRSRKGKTKSAASQEVKKTAERSRNSPVRFQDADAESDKIAPSPRRSQKGKDKRAGSQEVKKATKGSRNSASRFQDADTDDEMEHTESDYEMDDFSGKPASFSVLIDEGDEMEQENRKAKRVAFQEVNEIAETGFKRTRKSPAVVEDAEIEDAEVENAEVENAEVENAEVENAEVENAEVDDADPDDDMNETDSDDDIRESSSAKPATFSVLIDEFDEAEANLYEE